MIRRSLLETLFLALISAALGLVAARVHAPPLPPRLPAAFYAVEPGVRPLLQPQAEAMLGRGGCVFVDTRSEAEFRAGHIAGALHLPPERWRESAGIAGGWLEGARIILYGNADELSPSSTLAGLLERDGYGPLCILVSGYEAWREAGQAVEEGEAGILTEDPWESEEWDGEDSGPGENREEIETDRDLEEEDGAAAGRPEEGEE